MKYILNYNEFLNESKLDIKLCPIELDVMVDLATEKIFTSKNSFLENIKEYANMEISKGILINGEYAGGYILGNDDTFSMNHIKHFSSKIGGNIYENVQFYNIYKSYENKKGHQGFFLALKNKFRNQGFAKHLIDYSLSIGDYIWGLSRYDISTDYWLDKKDRILIGDYIYENKKIAITASKLI